MAYDGKEDVVGEDEFAVVAEDGADDGLFYVAFFFAAFAAQEGPDGV